MALGSTSTMVCLTFCMTPFSFTNWMSPRLPLAPCHICSCWYHGELVCLDCHRPGTLGQQNREVLASQWDVWQLKHMADQFSNEKLWNVAERDHSLVNDFGVVIFVPFAIQMKIPYQGLALDNVGLYWIAALKSPKSLRWFSFVLNSSIRYCDHASEEKLPALTFSIFCTIEECSGLGTWLLQRGLPDPCADLVADEWTLHEASSNPKVSAFPGLFLHSKGWSKGTNEVLVLIIELKDWRIGFARIALKDVVHCRSHALLYYSLASETRFNGSTVRCGRMHPL